MKYIVTTSLRMNIHLVEQARELSRELGIEYVERKKRSIATFLKSVDAVLVVYQSKLILEQRGSNPFFFHPDTALLRIKSGGQDPLLELLGLAPKQILDCTMGLASDSIVMASAGHHVTAIESSEIIYCLVSNGLKNFDSGNKTVNQAMRSIRTKCTGSLSFLKEQTPQSFDVIYFDPMFSENIPESQNLSGLSTMANYSRLTLDLFHEAKRVAKEKIIIKAHFRDPIFEELGIKRHLRPNQKFHYGEYLLGEKNE
ncbi:class I SAM-dependent methyltransferase [Streptococcus suis]|nr:class I SAM-dependent methyltransferase [Streptococcus suis]